MAERSRKLGKMKRVEGVKRMAPKSKETPTTLSKKVGIAAVSVLVVAAIAFVVGDISRKAKNVSGSKVPAKTLPHSGNDISGGDPDPKLFAPSDRDLKISRADIPVVLQDLIGGFGKVVHLPINYDPAKHNLYIIGAGHVESATGDYSEDGYRIQREILKIFHALFSIGVERQFLEGITNGEVLEHDVDNSKYGETPVRSMPRYRESGRIKRAYVAAEGVYGDAVESVGVDADVLKIADIIREYRRFDTEEFPTIVAQILGGIGKDLGISFDYDSLYVNPRALAQLNGIIRNKLSSMGKEGLEALAKKHVLRNSGYQRWLDVASEHMYMRLEGRNDIFVKGIRAAGRDGKKDSVFIVGENHVRGVLGQLEEEGGYNLFVIIPNSGGKGFNSGERYRTRQEYRDGIIEADLHNFGLGPEPKDPVGF
jgi:hypothetical protein